jgi:hypothetical protein
MRLPFYLRKSKTRFENGKMWLDIRMNWFDQLCLIIVMIFRRLSYFRKDSIWPSRKWNWNRTDYIDLSGDKNEQI